MEVLIFLSLCCVVIAFVPKWLKAWHWGRSKDSYPVSRFGCLGVAFSLLVMAAGVGLAQFKVFHDSYCFLVIAAGFLIFISMGLYDGHAR